MDFPTWILAAEDGQVDQHDVSVLTVSNTVSYANSGTTGYDEAGRLKGYAYTGQGYTHTYTYTYDGWDSYREKTVTGSSTTVSYTHLDVYKRQTFTLAVTNTAPVLAAAIPTQTLSRNLGFGYAFPAGTFTDANSDALSYSASGMPAGISFDAASRTFSGTPTTVGACLLYTSRCV